MLTSSDDDRESLRALAPWVLVNGRAIQSAADDPPFASGVAAVGMTYDCALDARDAAIATVSARRR